MSRACAVISDQKEIRAVKVPGETWDLRDLPDLRGQEDRSALRETPDLRDQEEFRGLRDLPGRPAPWARRV